MLQALKVPVAYTMAARMMNWKGSVSGTLTVRAFLVLFAVGVFVVEGD